MSGCDDYRGSGEAGSKTKAEESAAEVLVKDLVKNGYVSESTIPLPPSGGQECGGAADTAPSVVSEAPQLLAVPPDGEHNSGHGVGASSSQLLPPPLFPSQPAPSATPTNASSQQSQG